MVRIEEKELVSKHFPEIVEEAERLVKVFQLRAQESNVDGDWLLDNLSSLKESNFLHLTIPKEYGGYGLNLYEFLRVQETLARGDGATALSIGWHLGVLLEESENRLWKHDSYKKLCSEIVEEKKLINLVATEKATGSPARGGLPTTTATRIDGGWRITGEKSFTSMAIALDYSLVTARIEDTGEKGIFLVDHSQEGVKVEETWDSISMRATKSDDLILNHVKVEEEGFLIGNEKSASPKGWYLQIPAVYLGIATAASNYAVQFASEYHPNTLPGPIIEVPEVQRKIGEMELELFKAREILYSVARKWVRYPEVRPYISHELGAVKHIVTNSANTVVDLAMRIVGARSLSAQNPLQRYYRDVRAGLHNPPSDDIVIQQLAKNRGTDL